MPGALTALALLTVLALAALLRARLGLARALGVGLAATFLAVSAVGLVLLDLGLLRPWPLRLGLVGASAALVLAALLTRKPGAPTPPAIRRSVRHALALGLVLAGGVGLRCRPSPYLHGGQDQGIYVNVGHHIARTGRLRPVDHVLAGGLPGVPQADVRAAYRVKPIPDGSPLAGVREGRWIAGIHIEHAETGRLVPAFFHLLPVWFAISELDWGFSRSTAPLVLFWALSGLAIFALARRLASPRGLSHQRRSVQVGLIALVALALHPLDLWISSFTVTENLARACLLAAAWLSLEAGAAEREGQQGVALLAGLGGLCFAAGAFTRGSMVAHAIVLAAALLLAPTDAPRARTAFLRALVAGTTLAVVQAVLHSWPYFFSAATNHFHVPKLTPFQGEAVAWTLAAGLTVLLADPLLRRFHADPRRSQIARRLLRIAAGLALAAAAALLLRDVIAPSNEWSRQQQVLAVLVRHGGPLPLLLAALGLASAVRRADDRALPWLLLAAGISLTTALKPGVRYEFYYARYFVADAIPVALLAAACLLGRISSRLEARGRPRLAAVLAGMLALLWLAPPLRLLAREVYWTRDLEDDPAQLSRIFEQVPDDALLIFDDRAPGRWRGILATPALLSFGRNVLAVPPGGHIVEGALKAGTPVFLLSGGWEPDDRQRWPSAAHGPWRTRVVARGAYHAPRAEVVEGAVPARIVDLGGPWELQQLDRSIWRSSGAFSLYPDSQFLLSFEKTADRSSLLTETLPLPAAEDARVELWLAPRAPRCAVAVALLPGGPPLPLAPLPPVRDDQLLWALPSPRPPAAALSVTAACELSWRWLSVRPDLP